MARQPPQESQKLPKPEATAWRSQGFGWNGSPFCFDRSTCNELVRPVTTLAVTHR
jgi:hypothetical protein